MADDLLRLFIAIEASHDQKNELLRLQGRLKSNLEGVKWVRPEGLHLTLKFLGSTEKDKIALIEKLMESAVTDTHPFQVRYEGIGVFPNQQKARVVWVGLSEGKKEISELAKKIENNFSELQFKRENRPFYPHLTLGRFRYSLQEDLVHDVLMREKEFSTKQAAVDRITLYSSQLLHQGAVYRELYSSTF